MNSLFSVLLIVSITCSKIRCNTMRKTENLSMIRKSVGISTRKNNDNQAQGQEISSKDVPLLKQNPLNTEELKTIANTKSDSLNRKSKLLGSLAFLAGLSVGGLPGVALSNVKTYAKVPSTNFDTSHISPHVAAIYDPYSYASPPYIFPSPLSLYPLLHPLPLQYLGGLQNGLQPLMQSQETLNLLDNKKPTDPLNSNDEYIEVAKKVKNVKTSNDAEEETNETVELQVEDDRNAEEKVLSSETACSMQKGSNKKQNNFLRSKTREDADDSLKVLSFRAVNVTDQNATHKNGSHGSTSDNDTMTNSTMNSNETTTSPFYGYYGGYPQDINHIDFTTESNEYHNYEPINYNLPSYDKPANFYSDERYNFYSNPQVDSYSANQFQQEHAPEYFSNDFNKFLYTPENTPPFVNGFRPVA